MSDPSVPRTRSAKQPSLRNRIGSSLLHVRYGLRPTLRSTIAHAVNIGGNLSLNFKAGATAERNTATHELAAAAGFDNSTLFVSDTFCFTVIFGIKIIGMFDISGSEELRQRPHKTQNTNQDATAARDMRVCTCRHFCRP